MGRGLTRQSTSFPRLDESVDAEQNKATCDEIASFFESRSREGRFKNFYGYRDR